MIVWLISGKACSGKDTFAQLLQRELKDRSVIRHLATPLKEMAQTLWPVENPNDYAAKCAQRQNLIRLGSAVREIHTTTWSRVLKNSLEKVEARHVIIPDVRYWDECQFWLGNEVRLVRIVTDEKKRRARMEKAGASWGAYQEVSNHPSESGLDWMDKYRLPYFYQITNNGTVSDLVEKVRAIVAEEEVPLG